MNTVSIAHGFNWTWFQLQYCASIVQRQLVGFLWVGGVVYSHLDLIRRYPPHPCFGRFTFQCCNQDFHILGWKFEVKYYFQRGHFYVGVGDFGDHVHGFITSSFTRMTKLCQYVLQTCPPCFSESWARLYLILGSLDVDSTRQNNRPKTCSLPYLVSPCQMGLHKEFAKFL